MRLDQFPDKAAVIEYLKKEKGCATVKEAEKYLYQHLPLEPYYQDKIIKFLNTNYPDGVCWKEAAGPYSQRGIPDVTFIKDGRYYGFEVKRPYIGVLSKMQEQKIKQIRAAGGIAAAVCFPEEVRKIIEDNLATMHGTWEKFGYKWKCSCCGSRINIDGTPEENNLFYCSRCGANLGKVVRNEG